MRKVTLGGANSLDNFIARTDDRVDWIRWNKEVAEIGRQYWQTIDTVVMGRRTYEIMLQQGAGGYKNVQTFVCSRTLKSTAAQDIELISEDATDFMRRLKNQPGNGICVMGGGLLGFTLLEADLIDEIGVNIRPLLLGSGIPLFHSLSRQIDLELMECRQFTNGCVLLRYAVLRSEKENAE
jgi:dihydrofolate reductase